MIAYFQLTSALSQHALQKTLSAVASTVSSAFFFFLKESACFAALSIKCIISCEADFFHGKYNLLIGVSDDVEAYTRG